MSITANLHSSLDLGQNDLFRTLETRLEELLDKQISVLGRLDHEEGHHKGADDRQSEGTGAARCAEGDDEGVHGRTLEALAGCVGFDAG